MANIAVIVLNKKEIDAQPRLCSRRLQIEDNIGEAIHIHWRNLRLDFSVRDFIAMAGVCEQAKKSLESTPSEEATVPDNIQKTQSAVTGTNQSDSQNVRLHFNPAFIRTMGQAVQYVTGARVLQVFLDELLCIEIHSKHPYCWEPKPIIESKPYQYLQGNSESYNNYIRQFGEPEHGIPFLNQLKKSIEQHGYPYNNDMIVLFGDQPYIRDGQHRAAILRYLHGNIKVPVVQLLFKDDYTGWRMNPAGQKRQANESSFRETIGKANQVLIVRPDAIGDFVIFSGVLKHYRDLFKDAEITVLTQGHVTELALSCPHVDQVIGFNREKARTDQKYFSELLETLKEARFDIAINPVYSRDTISDSLTLGCGAKMTIASKGDISNIPEPLKEEHNRLYTKILPADDKPMPENERNVEFISLLAQKNIDRKSMPEIWINNEDEIQIDELLRDLNVTQPIVVSPFGKNPIRNWPYYKWARLISKHSDFPILICGGAQDYSQGEKIMKQAGHPAIYNLCGRITLRQLGALLKRARLCVGAESAAGHIAAAVGCPNVIIIGGGHFGRFMPYSPKTTLVYLPMDCYHCNWRCTHGQAHCISQIRIETVDKAMREVLNGSGNNSSEPTLVKETANCILALSAPVRINTDSLADIDIAEINRDQKYIVSAIVSTYKAECYMAGCLDDLENQTIADRLEIIVVDSGSKQNEKAVVERYQQRYDNIKYIRTEERETIYKAWNRAIKIATGKYITNANTDDRHRPDALETLVKAMEMYPDRVLAYPNQKKVSEENGQRTVVGELVKGDFTRSRLFAGECPPGSQPLWRRDVHEDMGYFDENFFIGGDLEFWFRLTQKYDFIYVDEFLGERLFRPDAVSIAEKELISYEIIVINKCYNYALQTSTIIDHNGISNNTLFSNWPEIQIWKQKVQTKIGASTISQTDSIKNQLDLRNNTKPKLSVVIVTYNRAQQLTENLNALQNQAEADFEVIVVSNGGELPELRTVSERFRCGLCCIELSKNFGPSYARNIGASKARADYLAFLDDDALPDKNFTSNILTHFAKRNISGLRGKVLPNNPANSQKAPSSYDLGDDVLHTTCEVSSHCAFKKDVFYKVGGYDTNLFGHENLELSYRIFKSLNETIDCIIYTPDVIVYHDPKDNYEQQVEKNLREEGMLRLARKKWPEIELYLQYVRSYYPHNIKIIERDYHQLISNCLFLQENSPQQAVEWARKAVSLEPHLLKGQYLLGTLYVKLGKYAEAETMLESVFASVMQSDELSEHNLTSSDLETNKTVKADCYISTGTKLAQSYLNQGRYDKVKQIYNIMLNDERLNMSQQQIASMRNVLAKLGNAPSLPASHHARKSEAIPESTGADSGYLVSAIISTYNAERFLRNCLDDLVQQTIADKLEIIVVNSGSQENEEAIVRDYQQKYNNIVYIKTEQREGIYTAWNRAVKAARGAFLTNANTDDRHRRDALEIMANTLQANPDLALVYGDQIRTEIPNDNFDHHHGTEILRRPEYSRNRLLFGCCVGSQPMWRRSLHEEFGFFDDTLTCAGDWDFWLRLSSKYEFKHIPVALGLYYYNKDGIEHGKKIHSLYERYLVGMRYGNPYISVIPLYESKDNPLVSVIMPAYNAAEYIAEAIESVLIQNYRNFELIIVDDGSTDHTKDIVMSFNNDKIKYFYKDKGGPSSARNFAIRKAEGQYIMPLDADDMITPDSIAKHLEEFNRHPEADLVYSDVVLINENGHPLRIMKKPDYEDRRHLIRDLFRAGHPIVPFRLGIKRSVFDKIGFYDEELLVGEDYDMMRRFVKAGLKAHHLGEALHLRRMQPDSLTRTYSTQKARCHFDVIKRFTDTFTHDELFPDVAWDEVPHDRQQIHAKCLVVATYLAMGEDFVKSNVPRFYINMAFEEACVQLQECLEIDPENDQIQQLLHKCESGKQNYQEQAQQAVLHDH